MNASALATAGRARIPARAALLRTLRNNTAFLLLIVLIVAGTLLSDVFLTPRNLLNILFAVSVLGVVALGQTMLLITGNFDMSVSYVVGLSGIVTVLAQIAGLGLAGSVLAGLGVGLGVGIVNGLLVVRTGANSSWSRSALPPSPTRHR